MSIRSAIFRSSEDMLFGGCSKKERFISGEGGREGGGGCWYRGGCVTLMNDESLFCSCTLRVEASKEGDSEEG